ncbi:DUF4073 domain-containing protein [Cohnella hashimotonis]|uniref:DUF4073 domain-containing protein n=1 Tax=Cohnella hashimotonis TaxID=2826895 RepID=A0ABT6TBP1_9BACL|nr:DUF4073 domain-containing protein [Cohnella hashimotonis]MDI4644253.1 DUF4073 domain-containing protein [Cohnella hashimotonis]
MYKRKTQRLMAMLLFFAIIAGLLPVGAVNAGMPASGDPVYIYYLSSDGSSSTAGANDALVRIGTDGSNETTIATEVAFIPSDLTLNIADEKAYYFAGNTASGAEKSIQSTSLTADLKSKVKVLAQNPAYNGMFYDAANGYLYYVSNDGTVSTPTGGSLRRMSPDGTNDTVIKDGLATSLGDLAMDVVGGVVYYFDNTAKQIKSIDIVSGTTGTVGPTLASSPAYSGMVFNPVDGYLYYLTADSDSSNVGVGDALLKIKPGELTGTTIKTEVAANPGDLAIDFASGTAYFFDTKTTGSAIKKLDLANGEISTFKSQTTMSYAGMYVTSGRQIGFDRAASSPADDATAVDPAADLSLKFSGKVLKGIAGNFVIKDLTSNTVLETIANGSSQITGWGSNMLTVNPSSDLPAGHEIAVTWQKAVVQDYYNSFISDNSSDSYYNFTVAGTAGGGSTFTVVNTNDSGEGSLRWAIAQAGAVADGKVVFDPALAGQTITLASDLTGWDELASEGTTIGNDSTNFMLTGLKDASGLPAITVDGNGHAGIRATGSGTFSLSDIRFTGFELNDSTGVYNGSGAVLAVSGSDYSSVTISNVRFDHNRMTSENNTSIVALSNDAHIDRVVFADNELNAFRADGPAYQATLLFMETQNGEITNSLFFNNSTSSHTSGDAYGGTIGNFMDFNLKVVNNTFYGNSVSNTGTGQALGPVGYAIESNVSSVEFYNNLMIDNIAQGQTVSAFGTVFYDDGGKVTTPNGNNVYAGFPFIDAIGGDFRLASSATGAIDQGDDSKSVGSFDLSGKARKVGSAVDIGAFEYVPGPVSNDASLTSILGKTDAAPGGGAGTYSDPITWSINVANNVTKLDKADIVPADSNAIVWFYDNSDFTSGSVYGVRSLNLPAGGSATAYIQIDSGSATRYYAVTVNRAAAAAPAYTINGTSQPWQDATLAADGDVLEITTDDSPASATRIHVTAPAGSTVTLKGKAGKIYDNVHVLVDEPITLKLENFNIAAPAGDTYNGIGFVKHNSPGDIVLETAGSNTIEGFNGIFSDSNHQLTINGTGTLTAKGRAAADPAADSGNGIYLLSDNTSGNTNPVASLTVDGSVMVKAYGGDSVGASGGNGIALNWGNLLIKSGDVEAYGGRTNGDRTDLPAGSSVTHRGGAGVYLEEFGSQGEAGKLSVEGGSLKAVGGEALADNVRGDFYEGGRGIRAYHSVAVSGGTVQSTGGTSVTEKGGDGIFTLKLDITGAAASVTANGGTSLSGFEAGTGLYVTNDIVIDGGLVSASGGNGMASEYGIYSPSGSLMIKGGADVTASGGSGAAAGASGGPAVYVQGNIVVTDSSRIRATGGAGQVNGSHGLFTYTGQISIDDNSFVTARGGNGATGVGGVGLRAFGNGSGSTVVIANDAGDVYVRGGQGASVTRPAVIAKDVRIAAGNVGPIAMEGTGNPRLIKNKSGGDDVYLVTVTTNPAAATSVFSQVSGTLAGNYTYEAPTLADGLAYMWLPSGTQTVGAAGYQNKTPDVVTDDTASTELTPLPVIAHLKHGSTTTDFTSIQAALDASVDGDTVTIEAGTYRDQLSVTKNITLQGAGIGQTIIESPNSNELVAANWKTLKNQTLYPVIGVKTSTTGEVVIKDLTIDGRKQGYIAAHAGDANVYTFNGIAVRDTSATIDQVKVIDVRDVYSDYSGSPVAPLPVDYLPQDQPSGANHNESILLEGAAGTGAHKVTVQNSEIVRFHKTGILAWGPALEVDIHDNKLQGHGKTLYSTGNGIQISSSDWSVNGGGDRRGTTGIVKDNEIYDIGLVIPEPGETGSYLNLGLGGPTGILLYQAGDGFVIEGNTITGPSVPSWHNSTTSNDGGYSNDGIGFSSSKDLTIRNNTITGFGTGIAEGGAVAGSTIEDNTFSANELDIWTLSGNDTITLGAGAETIAYNQTGNGIDTIDGFGAGDRLNVIGFVDGSVNGEIGTPVNAEYVTETGGTLVINGYTDALPVVDFTGGSVTAGDGTNVAARSVEVSVADGVTTLYIDTEGDDDAAELVIKLAGVYAPGNFKLNGGYISYITLVQATGLTVTSTDPAGSSNDGKTKIEATPIPATGHKLVYFNFGTGTVTIPNVGDTLPTYENLPNDGLVTAANGDNIGVAEVDANGKVVHFGQTTANVTAEPTPTQATGLTVTSTDPTGASNDNKTKLEATPAPATGHKLVYFNFGTGTVTIPNVGDTLPTYENLPSDGLVSAANGDNIGVAEVDANGKVVHFGQTTANVTAEPTPTQATGLTVTSTDPAGANNDGKTKLEATPAPATGHKLVYYNFSTGTVTIPNVGDTLPTYENLPSDGLVSAANGDNIGVAEVDEDGKVVHFGQTPASVSNTPGTTPEAIPTAAISYSDEVLTGLTPGAEYLIGGVTKTAGIDGKIAIEAGWLGTSLSIVKVGNGTSTTNSAPQTLVVPSRPTAPTGVGKTDETSAGNDGTITGVNSTLEYKKGAAGAWTPITGVTVTGLAPDTYYVRTAATATAFASEATSVTVGAFTSTPETTPNAAISYSDEVLTGLTPGAEYLIGGVTKTAGNDGKIAIEAGWIGSSLSIEKVGNGTSTTNSAPQTLVVPSRPTTPTGVGKTDETSAGGNNGTITGVNSTLEYKKGASGAWTPITGETVTGLAPDTYYVRTAATATTFASEATSVTVGAFTATPEAIPTAAISYSDEVLTGLTPGATYLIGGVNKTADGSGKLTIEAGWLGTSLSIVKVGNGASTTDSAAQSLSIPSRPVAPVVTANDAANTIAGLALGMEYAVDGGSYVKYNGTNAPDLSGTNTVQVRTSATETALAGTAATLQFTPNAPAAPNVSANDTLNTIVGADATMEYAIDEGSWVTFDPAHPPVLSGDHTVKVRVKAKGSIPAGVEKTIVFTANGTYSVLGTVVDDAPDANFITGAAVKVMKGNVQIGSTALTDANGHFKVTGVPNGTYNLVVTKEEQIITIAVTVKDQDYDFSPRFIVLPRGNKNSALEIKGDTPSVVVDGLNDLFADTQHAYTADDQQLVADGGSVKITLGVEKQDAAAATGASDLLNLAGGQSIDLYLDMTLTKTRIDTSNQTTTTALSTVGSLLKIIVPYDLSGKTNVTLYRFHDGVAQKMTKLALSTETPSTEGYMIDTIANHIIIWAQNFSTYAVAYGEIVSTPGTVSVGSLTIAASADAGGSISPAGNVAVSRGGSQTFTITPDAGYAISDVTVDGKSVGKVGSYTFANVTEAHTIKAVFAKAKVSGLPFYYNGDAKVFIGFSSEASGEMKYIAPAGKTIEFQANPKAFGDIANHWGKSYIDFVAERELFVGVSDRTFAPNTGMTRAMLATVIGRLYERSYGPLAATGQHAFTDVNYDSWYGAYLDWAASSGIVQGVGGTRFDPDRQVTRQELAAMLYRFAQFLKADTSAAAGTKLNYSDASAIDAWAEQAVLYGQDNGLINGRENGAFAPKESATRAEVSAILKRFIETIV